MLARRLLDDLCVRGVRRLLSAMGDPPLRVVLWDGRALGSPPTGAAGTLRVRDRAALLRLLADFEMQVGELYASGRVEIEGDPVALTRAVYEAGVDRRPGRRWLPWTLLDRALARVPAAGAQSARHHYDVDTEFYRLWLDERMVYTCAYFRSDRDPLEEAQVQKLDHVCRKLQLRDGDRVIEAGCGWGALALHMARFYGARVRAFNVSRPQLEVARERAEKLGLGDRVEFVEDDYRNIAGRCEKFVSVGMLEHVGREHYGELGAVIDRCLARDGIGLIHSVGISRPARINRWIARRVFPHAEVPRLRDMMDVFEPYELAVLDVENLRRHYALTLRHWLRRYDASFAAIEARVGREVARAWRLYLAGCAGGFAAGYLELFQVVFARTGNLAIPWTRAHLYGEERLDLGDDPGIRDGAG